MRILVVCGAGASSTFVALWVRRAAAARSVSASATASSTAELDTRAVNADVVLVGPHLAGEFDALAYRTSQAGAVAVLLPEHVVTTRDGDAALDIALATATASIC
ncbi:MAG TPA: hypothetical protein VIJ18_02715 [Microbacteriaceae bacterium]